MDYALYKKSNALFWLQNEGGTARNHTIDKDDHILGFKALYYVRIGSTQSTLDVGGPNAIDFHYSSIVETLLQWSPMPD